MEQKPEEYYLLIKGDTAGPYTLAELHQMWMEDKITLDTLFVRPGMRKCQPINLILGMVINYQEAQAVPAAAPVPALDENPLAPFKNIARWAVIIIVAVTFAWVIGPWRYAPEQRSEIMRAVVEAKPADLRVVNESEFEWKDVFVYINGQPPAGYKRKVASLKPGASMDITLLEFTDAASSPFEPWRMAVTEVWIGNEKLGFRAFRIRPLRI